MRRRQSLTRGQQRPRKPRRRRHRVGTSWSRRLLLWALLHAAEGPTSSRVAALGLIAGAVIAGLIGSQFVTDGVLLAWGRALVRWWW